MVELGDMVVGKHTGRHSPDDITLFCTANKTGNALSRLDHMAREGGNDASDDDPHR
jgi:ornithine cyclodeaminase/alanine dehydrogenase-like protein (mu-crystallin family)